MDSPSSPTPSLLALLSHLAFAALSPPHSPSLPLPSTALFFAERLYSLVPNSETALYLYAISLSHCGENAEALRILADAKVLVKRSDTLPANDQVVPLDWSGWTKLFQARFDDPPNIFANPPPGFGLGSSSSSSQSWAGPGGTKQFGHPGPDGDDDCLLTTKDIHRRQSQGQKLHHNTTNLNLPDRDTRKNFFDTPYPFDFLDSLPLRSAPRRATASNTFGPSHPADSRPSASYHHQHHHHQEPGKTLIRASAQQPQGPFGGPLIKGWHLSDPDSSSFPSSSALPQGYALKHLLSLGTRTDSRPAWVSSTASGGLSLRCVILYGQLCQGSGKAREGRREVEGEMERISNSLQAVQLSSENPHFVTANNEDIEMGESTTRSSKDTKGKARAAAPASAKPSAMTEAEVTEKAKRTLRDMTNMSSEARRSDPHTSLLEESPPLSLPPFCTPMSPLIPLKCNLARLALRAGDHAGAQEHYLQALTTQPGGKWCWEAIDGLARLGMGKDLEVLTAPGGIYDNNVLAQALHLAEEESNQPQPVVSYHHPAPAPTSIGSAKPGGAFDTVGTVSARPRKPPSSSSTRPPSVSQNTRMDIDSDADPAPPITSPPLRHPPPLSNLGQGPADKLPVMSPSSTFSFTSSYSNGTATEAISRPHYAPTSSASSVSSASSSLASNASTATVKQQGIKRSRSGVSKEANGDTTTNTVPKPTAARGKAPSVTSKPPSAASVASRESTAPVRRSTRLANPSAATATKVMRSTTNNRDPKKKTKTLSKFQEGSNGVPSTAKPDVSARDTSSRPAPLPPLPVLREAVQAEQWLNGIMKTFVKALSHLSRYECEECVDEIKTLPPEQRQSARAYTLIARAQLEMVNYQAAEKAFQRAFSLSPYLLSPISFYSTLLWHMERPVSLSTLAQELEAHSPTAPQTWIAAGNLFSHMGDHASALRCFERANRAGNDVLWADSSRGCWIGAGGMGGESVYALTLSGHECMQMEEWERALGYYRDAIKRDRFHYNAWFGLGNVFMKQGKIRLAEYYFRRAAQINPANGMVLSCFGEIQEKMGKKKEALETYQEAINLSPTSPAIRFRRARIWVQNGNLAPAYSELQKLLHECPDEFNVHFLLGRVCLLRNEKSTAKMHFINATDLEPRALSKVNEYLSANVGEEL